MQGKSLASAGATMTAILALSVCGSAVAARGATHGTKNTATQGAKQAATHAATPSAPIPGCHTGVWAEELHRRGHARLAGQPPGSQAV